MDIVQNHRGDRWTVTLDGDELGVIRLSRLGKHRRHFYAAYSAREGATRWHLATHSSLEDAVRAIGSFAADPWPFMGRVHRVLAEAVERS